MNAYFSIWKIIKIKKNFRILLNFSYYTIKQSHDEEVSFQDWLKAYILFSKALILNNHFNEGLELLRSLLDIFSNIPLEEIKYLSEIHKSNRVSTTNNFVNFDNALNFYSKYHVYKKCEAIFHFNYKTKTGKQRYKINSEEKKNYFSPRKSKSFTSQFNINDTNAINNDTNWLKTEFENSVGQDPISMNEDYNKFNEMLNNKKTETDDVIIEELFIDTVEKLEEYIEKYIDNINVKEENTCNFI